MISQVRKSLPSRQLWSDFNPVAFGSDFVRDMGGLRYTTTRTHKCAHCRKDRNAKGFTQHFKACAKKAETRQQNLDAVEAVLREEREAQRRQAGE